MPHLPTPANTQTLLEHTYYKVSKGTKIRNRYNQVPHLTQDTNTLKTRPDAMYFCIKAFGYNPELPVGLVQTTTLRENPA